MKAGGGGKVLDIAIAPHVADNDHKSIRPGLPSGVGSVGRRRDQQTTWPHPAAVVGANRQETRELRPANRVGLNDTCIAGDLRGRPERLIIPVARSLIEGAKRDESWQSPPR